jgi:hypothetical protein
MKKAIERRNALGAQLPTSREKFEHSLLLLLTNPARRYKANATVVAVN